ncbi:MAG: LysR family transcriptional regulator [Burkholderiaceae bacterium]
MKLPPLNALRAFDAVARLGGIRAAAQALNVTPSAVSQQVRQLEGFYGARLINRVGRNCELSEVGRTLFAGTSRHLRGISLVSESIRPRLRTITVVATTTVASRWLVPRLSLFMAGHPGTEVRVEAVTNTLEHRPGPERLVIHEGPEPPDPAHAELLFPLHLYPVASPAYVREHFGARHKGAARAQWPAVRLLHEPEYMWWPQWFQAHGVAYPGDSTTGLHFSHLTLTLSSALHGHGVGLAPLFLIAPELAAKALAVADRRPLITPVNFHATWSPEESASARTVATLRDWLVQQARGC